MTTESAKAGQDEAEKIWAEMDASDAGKSAEAAAAPALEQIPAATPAADAKPEGSAKAAEPAATAVDTAAAVTVSPGEQLLLDKINGLENDLRQTTGRLRKVEGHYGELKGQQKAALETAAAGSAAPTATQLRDAQASPEKMAALERDYPEFAAAMKGALDERVSGLQAQLNQLQAQQKQQPNAVTAADIVNLRAELAVEHAHAGWKETVQQPEFKGWLTRQPREVQMLAASDSPQDAIRLLDLHVEARKPAATPTPNNRRLETAAAIPDGRSTNQRAKPVEEMTGEEYWRYLDQQEAQQARQG